MMSIPAWPQGLSLLFLIDAILVFTLIEAMALVAWRRLSGGGIALSGVLPNLLSGLALMAAVRGALSGWSPWTLLLLMSLSGLAHAWDLWRRWPRRQPSSV